MDKEISNFVCGSKIKAFATQSAICGPLVTIEQSAGSMQFHFSMTPEQARELGAALYELADSLNAQPLTKEAA